MPADLFSLKGKTALITGSGGGLGFTLARGLGAAGAAVILNGRNVAKLEAAAAELDKLGVKVTISAFDVTDSADINKQIDRLESSSVEIDILINNAGIQKRMMLTDMTDEAWQTVIDTDLSSAFYVTRRVVRKMIERQNGKIINICSLMSEVHRPSIANYTAAKGGLKMLTRAMAVEFGRHNIQANGIGPGYFATEMTEPLVKDEAFNSWICSRTPAGRWGKPQELVGPAVFLASDASAFVSGQIIYVDGGLLAGL